jgi:CheY-like chemotaxis protein
MTHPAAGEAARRSPSHVLIVDTDAESREHLSGVLRDRGYQVSEASSSETGLAVLRGHATVDLIVLEVDPAQDASWIVDEQRRDLIAESIPVLAFAVPRDEADSTRLLERRALSKAELIDQLLRPGERTTFGAASETFH